MDTIMFGVPAYGGQSPVWWTAKEAVALSAKRFGLEYHGTIVEQSAVIDHNFNNICDKFLKEGADWLMWIETDTVPPTGALGALYDVGHPIVSGLYQMKKHPYLPIAYYKRKDGLYQNIDNFHRGAIFPVDATGFGCLLLHRSVLEEYKKNYTVLQRASGGYFSVLTKDIKGKIRNKANASDGEVINGVLQERVWYPNKDVPFPFFVTEYGRTQDIYFFEKVAALGYKPMLNTSVVCSHIGEKAYKYEDYYKQIAYDFLGKKTPPELLHENS